jgi:hypothetical protein
MGELIDITGTLKEIESLRKKEIDEKQHHEKLSENGLICFDRFNEFLDSRKANEVGKKYHFISQDFLDQYKGGVFDMNTVLSAIAGELTSTFTDRKSKKRIIDTILPDLNEIIEALEEDQFDLSLLMYEIESMNPSPTLILEKVEKLYFLQKEVIELYEIIAISSGCKLSI